MNTANAKSRADSSQRTCPTCGRTYERKIAGHERGAMLMHFDLCPKRSPSERLAIAKDRPNAYREDWDRLRSEAQHHDS